MFALRSAMFCYTSHSAYMHLELREQRKSDTVIIEPLRNTVHHSPHRGCQSILKGRGIGVPTRRPRKQAQCIEELWRKQSLYPSFQWCPELPNHSPRQQCGPAPRATQVVSLDASSCLALAFVLQARPGSPYRHQMAFRKQPTRKFYTFCTKLSEVISIHYTYVHILVQWWREERHRVRQRQA